MLQYLILIMDRAAVSFCHYAAPASPKPGPIAIEDLRAAVDFAIRNRLALNCLLGPEPLPEEHERALSELDHVKLVPFELRRRYPAAIVVLDRAEQAEALEPDPRRNAILRLARGELGQLGRAVEALTARAGRVNLRLLELERYGDPELRSYREQLELCVGVLRRRYQAGENVELSFLTDRLLSRSMRNCNPGLEHLTLGPDGALYLCPAFYPEGPRSGRAGDLRGGISIPNPQLLALDHAPICRVCEAYHCKRCLHLNLRTTGELNTPSEQQCVLAHHEHNASATLQASLLDLPAFRAMPRLARSECLDPLLRVAPPQRPPILVRDGQRLVRLPPLERIRLAQKERTPA